MIPRVWLPFGGESHRPMVLSKAKAGCSSARAWMYPQEVEMWLSKPQEAPGDP